MAIASSSITGSGIGNDKHHANQDLNDGNMHYPKGFRSATAGDRSWMDEQQLHTWEQFGHLPAALDYADSSASQPSSTDGDIYILDDSTTVLTITSIAWQSGNTVRYTFSGSPDLSGYSTANNVGYFYGSGITNSDVHVGRFELTAVNNTTKYVEVSNPLVSSVFYDESGLSNASAELPHVDWDGASNGDWVRYSGEDTLWYRVTPIEGVQCYDKTLAVNRVFDGTRWLGYYREMVVAVSDEATSLTTGTAKLTFRMPYKMYLSEVRASVTTAPTGSTLDVDINESGASILSTVITIDATEKTSTTAATAAVISDNVLADDAEITIDIDQVGSTVAGAGLKVYLLGWMI